MEKTKRKNELKTGLVIRGYWIYMASVAVVLAAATVGLFFLDKKAGIISAAVFIIFVIISVFFIVFNSRRLLNNLLMFAHEYENMEMDFIMDFPLPYVVMDQRGNVLLYNDRFSGIYDGEPGKVNICDLIDGLKPSDLKLRNKENDIAIIFDDRNYRLHLTKMEITDDVDSKIVMHAVNGKFTVITGYLFDETEVISLMQDQTDRQLVVGNVYVDNFEETLDQAEDIKKTKIAALIDEQVVNYFVSHNGIIRKTENSKYFIVLTRADLARMQSEKFDILEKVRNIETGIDVPVTLSVGIGVGTNYQKSFELSKTATELALGRGGDQVVVKDGERNFFYGGKTKSVERNTRVKARVTSTALREIITGKDHVVIMGHKTSDSDCLGASIGIYRIAKSLGKKAYVVLNELTNTVQPLLEDFMDNDEYADTFIPVNEAPNYVDNNTALIIVDVNNPDLFECEELIHMTKTIVMIDHHLQTGIRINNVVLSYVEPTASSASEMISELLQYMLDRDKPTKLEAEALYGGILIDTSYFSKNTGVRTFEAAAYLRKLGTDVARVKNLFSDTLEDFKVKAKAISSAKFIADGYALAVCPSEGLESPTVVAARIANDLLEISSVKASFVLVSVKGKVFISARSNGDTNVQIVMERMGGGGHMNIAGAQMPNSTIEETAKNLTLTVNKMIEEGILK